ncbi:hypothetical protein ACH4EC_35720 [Streptomyces anulatus]
MADIRDAAVRHVSRGIEERGHGSGARAACRDASGPVVRLSTGPFGATVAQAKVRRTDGS